MNLLVKCDLNFLKKQKITNYFGTEDEERINVESYK